MVSSDETLHAFAESWFQARSATLRPATIKIHNASYKRRIAPTLGAVRLDELTRERLEAWLGQLVRLDSAHRAVEQSIATLRAMLSAAVEWDRIPTNPALRLRMPKRSGSEHAAVERVLTPAQVELMLAHAAEEVDEAARFIGSYGRKLDRSEPVLRRSGCARPAS